MTEKEPPEEEILGAPIQEELLKGPKIAGTLTREVVIAEDNDITRDLYNKTRYGEPQDSKEFHYSLLEALYLFEREKMILQGMNKRPLTKEAFLKKSLKAEPNFMIRYAVFKDLRKRGYIVKTALKFGADFRVYERGVKPGEEHARWIVFPVAEADTLTWFEFSAKNRVAHSTRKRLLLAIVDAETECTFYECRWLRP
ncbi:MAG TPA: tRNA-intron lyase [Candidatus Nanoarchaeia archaeon]|nr:tRNA-intron lyase [Candidatus Nanoarchaeia archaeon]